MNTFDQRGQQVTYQYNAVGNINFGSVQTRADLVLELEKLQTELTTAIERKAIREEAAIDAKSSLKEAVLQAEQPNPNKGTLLGQLNKAKSLVVGVSGLVDAFTHATEKVKVLF